jgi:hypothetical protein
MVLIDEVEAKLVGTRLVLSSVAAYFIVAVVFVVEYLGYY